MDDDVTCFNCLVIAIVVECKVDSSSCTAVKWATVLGDQPGEADGVLQSDIAVNACAGRDVADSAVVED